MLTSSQPGTLIMALRQVQRCLLTCLALLHVQGLQGRVLLIFELQSPRPIDGHNSAMLEETPYSSSMDFLDPSAKTGV